METGASYAAVLAEAQALGYAEADPSADVDGFDARAKLCILSRIAMQAELDPDAVATQTISTVEAIDFAYAKELGCTIRQVSRAAARRQGQARPCPRRAHARPAHLAHRLVARHAEHGRHLRPLRRRCGLLRPWRRRRAYRRRRRLGHPRGRPALGRRSAATHAGRLPASSSPRTTCASSWTTSPASSRGIAGALAKVGANIDSLLQHPGHPKHRLPFVITTEPCLTSTIEAAVNSIAQARLHAGTAALPADPHHRRQGRVNP